MRLAMCFGIALLLAGCSSNAPVKKKAAVVAPRTDGVVPDVWKVLFDTSKGSFVLEVHKEWAPKGAERFWKLVRLGFFNNTRVFRVRPGFIAQFGLSGDPQTNSLLSASVVEDDPVKQRNEKGTIAFAQSGPRSRRTQVFVNLKDNVELDKGGFVPFGKVNQGMDVFEKLYSGYGEWEPPGRGPNAMRILTQGNEYLDTHFPKLDKILRAKVVK